MSFNRFWLINESERQLLREQLTRALQQWRRQWLDDTDEAQISLLTNVAELPVADCRWLTGATSLGLTVAVGTLPNAGTGLGHVLSGLRELGTNAGEIAEALETAVRRALIETVLLEAGHTLNDSTSWRDGVDDKSVLTDSRGYVAASVDIGDGLSWVLLLYPKTTQALTSTLKVRQVPAVLTPTRRAIESQTAAIEVTAGDAELTLQEMATLAVGDVIRLDHKLEDPLPVLFGDDGRLVAGHLGTAGEHKAIQLTLAHK
ncbi:MAG: FliM/FliN family flagellar motor switch protein [Gammaproteobacteria bacterium]|nr:FliM/FliN family flagellar motor switch protein [Gammaproteobacteria bacterium]